MPPWRRLPPKRGKTPFSLWTLLADDFGKRNFSFFVFRSISKIACSSSFFPLVLIIGMIRCLVVLLPLLFFHSPYPRTFFSMMATPLAFTFSQETFFGRALRSTVNRALVFSPPLQDLGLKPVPRAEENFLPLWQAESRVFRLEGFRSYVSSNARKVLKRLNVPFSKGSPSVSFIQNFHSVTF